MTMNKNYTDYLYYIIYKVYIKSQKWLTKVKMKTENIKNKILNINEKYYLN